MHFYLKFAFSLVFAGKFGLSDLIGYNQLGNNVKYHQISRNYEKRHRVRRTSDTNNPGTYSISIPKMEPKSETSKKTSTLQTIYEQHCQTVRIIC